LPVSSIDHAQCVFFLTGTNYATVLVVSMDKSAILVSLQMHVIGTGVSLIFRGAISVPWLIFSDHGSAVCTLGCLLPLPIKKPIDKGLIGE